MKTKNKMFHAMVAGILMCGLTSCFTRYRVATTIHSDGSCLREIYARGDSAFLAGDLSRNPYLFSLDSSWQITLPDTAGQPERYNVKIGKTFRTVAALSTGLQVEERFRPLAVPEETLHKRFRWFYTYYTFKASYPGISEKIPVAIDRYMNRDEQKLWFQGDFSTCSGMTGWEVKEKMDEIETHFYQWYARNIYEAYIEAVCRNEAGCPYLSQLSAVKDALFETKWGKAELNDSLLSPEEIYRMLDESFHTGWFSDYYEARKQAIEDLCAARMQEDLLSKEIEYRLTIPGKLVCTNAPLIHQDTLTWNITALRLIPGDYELTATSRTFHPWAVAVVAFLAALSVYCLIRVKKYRNGV
ncbi:MAG: hypothetical protein LBB85_00820 [Dysgonamonadaceae bacterium]|jgi:hypothetical protein|nr:hypothetical protein [Dysgonamonadaceae bacterium]